VNNVFDKEINIISRDVNGKRNQRFYDCREDFIRDYLNGELDILDAIDEEILMVLYKDCCIYSQLQSSKELTWEELYGFFA